MTTLQYHVLGNAERHDALMHCLVEKHVRATHGIDLKITHDASSAFKMPVQNRQVWIPDPARQSIRDVSIKSQQIYIVSPGYGSAEEQVYGAINNAMVPYGMGPFNSTEHPFYVDRYPGVQKKYEDKKASTLGNFLPMMLMLNTYAQLDEWCEQATEQCYPYYEAEQKDDFEREIAKVIFRFGSRCDMEGACAVARAITKSLDMLSDLDLDYNMFLVRRHLSDQEHPSISQSRRVA